jgi:RNA-directed DNA polymerase
MNMHADENSDGVIVPEKRPNKEGLPSAEAVEGRTPPKGNGGETAAARTLRRDTASNGLIAVRRAARQSKSVRFTALLHHITIDLLKRSYLNRRRDVAELRREPRREAKGTTRCTGAVTERVRPDVPTFRRLMARNDR